MHCEAIMSIHNNKRMYNGNLRRRERAGFLSLLLTSFSFFLVILSLSISDPAECSKEIKEK